MLFASFGGVVVVVPLLVVDLASQGSIVAKGHSEELERADVVVSDASDLERWLVNMLNVTVADREATAWRSVVDVFVAVTAGVSLARLTGRESGWSMLELRLCFFV